MTNAEEEAHITELRDSLARKGLAVRQGTVYSKDKNLRFALKPIVTAKYGSALIQMGFIVKINPANALGRHIGLGRAQPSIFTLIWSYISRNILNSENFEDLSAYHFWEGRRFETWLNDFLEQVDDVLNTIVEMDEAEFIANVLGVQLLRTEHKSKILKFYQLHTAN
jgi:hypothetical protein